MTFNFEEFREAHKNADLKELAERYLWLRMRKEELDAELAEINKAWDWVRITRIPELMDDQGIRNIVFEEYGRIRLTADLYAGIMPDQKLPAYDWLRDNGHDIGDYYVQPSTLKALLKQLLESGTPIPEDLFRVTPFQRASISKV